MSSEQLMPMNRIFYYEPRTGRYGPLLGCSHNPDAELARLMVSLAQRNIVILMLLFTGQEPKAIAVGKESGQYSNPTIDVVRVRGIDTIVKLHWVDTEKRTIYLLDNNWGFPSNCTLPRGTKLVTRSNIHWSDVYHNTLYLESAATQFLGRGVLIELTKDTPLVKAIQGFDCYEATSFKQLEELYQNAVPYEPSNIPKLGPNNFDFKPDTKPYDDFDNNFDRDYEMFVLSHATPEQLQTRPYQNALASFGIVLNPQPDFELLVEK